MQQHYLKTYKKLESLGLTTPNENTAVVPTIQRESYLYNQLFVVGIVRLSVPAGTTSKKQTQLQFDKRLLKQLGLCLEQGNQTGALAGIKIVGTGLRLVKADVPEFKKEQNAVVLSYERRVQTKAYLSLIAASAIKKLALWGSKLTEIDQYHLLGGLLVSAERSAPSVFIGQEELKQAYLAPECRTTLLRCMAPQRTNKILLRSKRLFVKMLRLLSV